MDGEIGTFFMIWASIFTLAIYCYYVAETAPEGLVRLVMFLPVIFLFTVLPFKLNSVHLGCPTFFFISWLANSKLLLLAFGTGPLSSGPPSLSLIPFVLFTCFPLNIQRNKVPKGERQIRDPLHFANCAIGVAILLYLGQNRDRLHRKVFLLCSTMYIYSGLDLMLSVVTLIGEILLSVELESPFNNPLKSTSLKDFWGRRWNRVASENLRTVVFWPIYNYSTSRKVGHKWALVNALIATFFMSAFIHELLMYYLGRTWPTFRITMFFIFHGVCLVVEAAVTSKFTGKWTRSMSKSVVTGPLIFGFVIGTAMWLLVQDMADHKVEGRVVEEWIAFGAFLKDLGTFLVRKLLAL
ncbi:OLC1v1020816C1 [Oldenlandia corymbosa var. corymbosa]|uniref:OLC1v1020816C1 n=1 Tax=Oldenlandia corymbosa var. corymbosa TaxID=529605 RepID=A0AAV1BWQ6_OLDCO|nr:OLC1v1020816C1 [Oldenlandia corymbosa var. corymbosa]